MRDARAAAELRVAAKPDSQEICFVPDGDYAAFIERAAPGAEAAGRARRITTATSSARTQACIALPSASARAWACRRASRSTCWRSVPTPRRSSSARATRWAAATLTASQVNWVSGHPPNDWTPVTAQIRHRHAAAPARVRALDDARAELEFDEPQSAITPGQAVVFYDGDVCLGGGWID